MARGEATEVMTYDGERAAEYELELTVGEPAAPDGQTRVRLDGRGHFVARQYFEDAADEKRTAPREVEGEIPPQEARRVLNQASAFDWDRRFPSRPGIPDEAIANWSLGARDGSARTVRVWLTEAEDDPAMGPVLDTLRAALDRFSQGALYL